MHYFLKTWNHADNRTGMFTDNDPQICRDLLNSRVYSPPTYIRYANGNPFAATVSRTCQRFRIQSSRCKGLRYFLTVFLSTTPPHPYARLATADATLPHPCSRLATPKTTLPHPCSRLATTKTTLPHPCSRLATTKTTLPHPCSRLAILNTRPFRPYRPYGPCNYNNTI